MKQYFVFLDNKKQGPYSLSELEKLDINLGSLIWTKGMSDWTKASEIDELNTLLENVPPPLPNKIPLGFFIYLKKNYKYIILTFILSIIFFNYIDNNFFHYMINTTYGGYDGQAYTSNHIQIDNEVQGLQDILMSFVLFLGIFLVPILYLFKNKK